MVKFILILRIISHFLLCQVKRVEKNPKDGSMFNPFIPSDLSYYCSPEIKDSDSIVDDDYFIASFLKGSKDDSEIDDEFCQIKIPDVANAWNTFDVFQVYPRNFSVTSTLVDSFRER